MSTPLSILVYGAGAIGTYIGGSLALAGHRLTFIEQPQTAVLLQQTGLRLDLTLAGFGHEQLPPAAFTVIPSLADALRRGPFDFAVFALKSFDTAAALEEMQPFAGDMPPVLCLQNGVDNEARLVSVLGGEKVIAGTVTSSVGRRAAGDIVLERLRGVGIADGHPLSLFINQALSAAGLKPRLFPRPLEMKWSKMLTNLPANATAAILDMTAAQVFDHPGLFRLEIRMLRETLTVMRALRLRVVDLPGVPTRLLALGIHLPQYLSRPLLRRAIGSGRGAKMPSFHIDLHSGRGRSEVDWLNGAVARHGAGCGCPAPVNQALTDTLLALTRGTLPLTVFQRQPERLLEILGKR